MQMAFWKNFWRPGVEWWLSMITGAVLGCLYRLFFSVKNGGWPLLTMTVGFLILVPLAVGYLAVDQYLRRATEEVSWFEWFFLPWLSVGITMAVSVVVHWEGAICLIFAAPIMLISSAIGGVLARVLARRRIRSVPGQFSVLTVPLLVILLESQIAAPLQIRSVETDLLIHAPAGAVWDNIRSVRRIDSSELPDSWVTRIGFPKPVAATLSHDGVGGVRRASFTGGLVFTETINQWDPGSDLRFSIHANTDSIPPGTLDEHVTIGGAFFDVLDGEYRLEPRPDGVLLRLTSHERLSTHLNPYAGVWTDAVMRSIQSQILAVIRRRCEAGRAAGTFLLSSSRSIAPGQEAAGSGYKPPPTLERNMMEDPVFSNAIMKAYASGDRAGFRAFIEKQAAEGNPLGEFFLGAAYIPPECTFLPFKNAPVDCPGEPASNNPLGLISSFPDAIHWFGLASAQGNGEASEALAQVMERAIRSSATTRYQMTDVAHYHALARSQGYDLQNVDYSCYSLDAGHPDDLLVMPASVPPEFRLEPEVLAALHAAGASGTVKFRGRSDQPLTVLLRHPEGPKVHISVVVAHAVSHEIAVPLPDRVDVVFMQAGDGIIPVPSSYPKISRVMILKPPTKEGAGGAAIQSIDGTFENACPVLAQP
jgi:hypothetical protein